MTLTEFLLARIAEDEKAARNALHHSRWVATMNDHDKDWTVPVTSEVWTEPFNSLGRGPGTRLRIALVEPEPDGLNAPSLGYDAHHIARHDPARVLAECEAKRRIVKDWAIYSDARFPDFEGGYASAMDDAVSALASVYADHPDYPLEREEAPAQPGG